MRVECGERERGGERGCVLREEAVVGGVVGGGVGRVERGERREWVRLDRKALILLHNPFSTSKHT